MFEVISLRKTQDWFLQTKKISFFNGNPFIENEVAMVIFQIEKYYVIGEREKSDNLLYDKTVEIFLS